MLNFYIDGTPCAVKVACTVWSGGKSGEHSKDYLSLFIKAILDALNGVAYRDDSQICRVYFDSQCCAAGVRKSSADEQEEIQSAPSEQCNYISDRAKMYAEIAETKVLIKNYEVC